MAAKTATSKKAALKYLEIKADLLIDGVDATPDALVGIGTLYKEQNHGLFGWDFEDHSGTALPDDFELPDGTLVQFRRNRRSRFKVISQNGRLCLTENEAEICPVDWLPRPGYYNRETNSKNKMVKIGQTGGADCLFFCYQNYCSHFSKNEQCLFCNLVATSETYGSVLKKKDTRDIGEVAAAAFAERQVKHVLLTGGCFNHQKELDLVSDVVQSIRTHTGLDRVPGTVLPSPAKTPDDIKRYYDTGIQAIGFSLEIWDDRLYRAICPGKSAGMSHDAFVTSVSDAVKIFGAGNVYGVLVMGLETAETFLDGVKTLSGLGANIVPFVWSPNPGSKLAGHRAPTRQWYIDSVIRAADIVHKAGVPAGTANHCYRCDGNSLLHDALRLNGIT